MDYEKLVERLLERVELLEEQHKSLVSIVRKIVDKGVLNSSSFNIQSNYSCVDDNDEYSYENVRRNLMDNIIAYIDNELTQAYASGLKEVIIRSGSVHKAMNLTQRMPSVCNAMRKASEDNDLVDHVEVIKDTPSHNSSTYTMKYFLKEGD